MKQSSSLTQSVRISNGIPNFSVANPVSRLTAWIRVPYTAYSHGAQPIASNVSIFLADPEDSQTSKLAEANQFHLVDVRMTLERSLAKIPPIPRVSAFVQLAEQDVLALRTIARSAHRDTRFHFDQHFDRTKCDLLYEIWIEKSVSGFADMVFVAEVGGKPVAYITGHLRDDEVQIGLMAIDEAHQGKGLASILA